MVDVRGDYVAGIMDGRSPIVTALSEQTGEHIEVILAVQAAEAAHRHFRLGFGVETVEGALIKPLRGRERLCEQEINCSSLMSWLLATGNKSQTVA